MASMSFHSCAHSMPSIPLKAHKALRHMQKFLKPIMPTSSSAGRSRACARSRVMRLPSACCACHLLPCMQHHTMGHTALQSMMPVCTPCLFLQHVRLPHMRNPLHASAYSPCAHVAVHVHVHHASMGTTRAQSTAPCSLRLLQNPNTPSPCRFVVHGFGSRTPTHSAAQPQGPSPHSIPKKYLHLIVPVLFTMTCVQLSIVNHVLLVCRASRTRSRRRGSSWTTAWSAASTSLTRPSCECYYHI